MCRHLVNAVLVGIDTIKDNDEQEDDKLNSTNIHNKACDRRVPYNIAFIKRLLDPCWDLFRP